MKTIKPKIRRLRILHDQLYALDEVTPKKRERKFDLMNWHRDLDCETTACAIGEACVNPKFNKLGLTLQQGATGTAYPVYKTAGGQHRQGWYAVMSFFGLKEYEARFLFSYDCYTASDSKRPCNVAYRIGQFIEENA